VGQDVELAVPAKRGEPQRRVRVLVRSEGPTRVLTVLDTRRHSLPAALAANGGGDADAQASGRGLRGPWEAWSLPSLGGKDQERRRRAKAPGTCVCVCVFVCVFRGGRGARAGQPTELPLTCFLCL
jgi:hypothetical protein